MEPGSVASGRTWKAAPESHCSRRSPPSVRHSSRRYLESQRRRLLRPPRRLPSKPLRPKLLASFSLLLHYTKSERDIATDHLYGMSAIGARKFPKSIDVDLDVQVDQFAYSIF